IVSFYFIYHDIRTRKKSEEQLKKFNEELEKQVAVKTAEISASEEKYRSLFESMSDAYAKTDIEGTMMEFNPSFRNMLGYSDKELQHLSFTAITPSRWHEFELKQVRRQVLERGYSDVYEKEYIHKSGKIFPVELRSFLLKNSEGEPIGMWAIVRDITQRKEAEKKLQHSERNLRHVLSSTSDNFYVVDKEYVDTLINESAKKNLELAWGKRVDMGSNILSLIPELKSEPVKSSFEKVFAGEQVEYELHHTLEGLPIWVLVSYSPVSDDTGKITGAYVVSKDITERKQAEIELVQAESKFRNLVEQSLIGVYILHGEVFSYVNPRFASIFGYDAKELINMHHVHDLIHPDDRERVAENIRIRVMGEKDRVHYEARGIRKDGEIIHIEVFCSGTIYTGQPAIIGTILDVSERKRAEAAIKESEERYRALVENAPEALVVFDIEDRKFVSVSESAVKMFKYSKEELLKLGPVDVSPQYQPDGRLSADVAAQRIGEAIHGQKPVFEWTHCDSTGAAIPCEVWLVRLPSDKRILIRGSLVDISERKRMDAEKDRVRFLLNERVKELTTLYQASRLLETEEKPIDDMLGEIVSILPGGWQHSNVAAARITLGDMEITSPNYGPGYHRQMAHFTGPKGETGIVEVVYLEKMKGSVEEIFFTEERNLMKMVAEMIRIYLARKHEAMELKKSQQEILDQKVQAQKTITRAVLNAEEKERNKIGQELHDNINQILVSIKLYLSMAGEKDGADGKQLIKNSVALIDNAIREIRALSNSQVTPVREINLEELIRSLIDKLDDSTRIVSTFQYAVNGKVIADDLKLNIYRIIQEQINNLLKHAGASKLSIRIVIEENYLQITTSDDGKGFDPSAKRKGIGLSNIMNRVESFNGTLTIESGEGKGTKMTIRIPC
ncbi:MAG: PAS domain S-box protein, partial [Chitinophagaceae bacterium]|nr:PAS domain S-box protein [Chitinophagaceae bacterium]